MLVVLQRSNSVGWYFGISKRQRFCFVILACDPRGLIRHFEALGIE